MTRKSKNIATFGTIAALAAASVVVPAVAASAAPTECEPGYVNTTFASSVTSTEPVGTITGMNPTAAPFVQTFKVSSTTTTSASVTGSVSIESVMIPLKAEVSATAAQSWEWSAGSDIPIEIAPGSSVTVTYGFANVSFTGSQKTCQSNGMFGAASSFSGVAPTGIYTTPS